MTEGGKLKRLELILDVLKGGGSQGKIESWEQRRESGPGNDGRGGSSRSQTPLIQNGRDLSDGNRGNRS